jgi:trimeric autotransporter adhesin
MDLRGQEIKNTYGNVVTVGSGAGAPTTGELTNGQNTSFTSTYLGGNFGIGSAPTTYGSLNVLGIGSAASAGGAIIDIVGTSGRLASIYTEASGKLVFTADPTNAQAGTALEFNVDGSNAMFIDSSRNVGIGLVLPTELLHVAGNLKLSDNADRSIKGPANANLIISNNASSSSQGIKFSTDGGTTTDVFIQDGGNVGIGTSSPSQDLHVDGNVRITGAVYDSNNVAGTSGQVLSSTGTGTDWVSLSEISGVDGTGTANYISKWSDTDTITDSQIQDDGTTVGIGQAPSTAKLTVSGDIQTAAPETTTASAWKLGTTNLGGVFVATADYVTVEVNGFIVKLPIAIAPDTQDYYDRVISDGGSFEGVLSYESATTILKSN